MAQAPGPQLAVGVTAAPVCQVLLALRQEMVTEGGRITPVLLSGAVIQTAALVGVCGVAQVAWAVPPVLAVKLSRASANCGP